MKERPIIFSGSMVTGILDERKTQTRRVLKPQPKVVHGWNGDWLQTNQLFRSGATGLRCPYGTIGDHLWIRESWRAFDPVPVTFGGSSIFARMPMRVYASPVIESESIIEYKADNLNAVGYKSSIHMPRWASRITLEITDVRVERLNSISWQDAIKEGFRVDGSKVGVLDKFEALWNKINGKKHPWASNPYVWVIEFKKI